MIGDSLSTTNNSDIEPRPNRGPDQRGRSSTVLLEQFYVTLRAMQRGIDRSDPGLASALAPGDKAPPLAGAEATAAIRRNIDTLFSEPLSWRSAYEIEQLQCLLLTGGQLKTEMNRRFDEAEARKLASTVTLKALVGPPENWAIVPEDEKRAVLHRLVNDLQWFYTQRFQRRGKARLLNHRVSLIFVAAFPILLAALVAQLTSVPARPWEPSPRQSPAATGAR